MTFVADDIAAVHPTYSRLSDDWQTCRDLFVGTRAIRDGRERYLPRFPRESMRDYDRRRNSAEVYNGFRRTVRAATGLLFARPPKLTASARMTRQWEDVDRRRNHANVFLRRAFEDAMQTGHGGILVDYSRTPAAEGRVVTLDSQRQGAHRTHWAWYSAEQIVNWASGLVNGVEVLTLLVLEESRAVRKGRYGHDVLVTRRIFENQGGVLNFQRRVRVAVGQGTTPGTDWMIEDEGTLVGISEIPFSPCVLSDGIVQGWFESSPPLLDLADMNLAHWRVKSDRRNSMHVACVPIMVRVGYKNPQNQQNQGVQEVSINRALDIPDPSGRAYYLEHAGAALGTAREELLDIERQMGQLGLSFLMPDTRQAETAEARRIDKHAETATLLAISTAMQDCVERALAYDAEFAGDDASGEIEFFVDSEGAGLTVERATLLLSLANAGKLTLDSLLRHLKAGKILDEETNIEAEVKALEQQAADRARDARGGPSGTKGSGDRMGGDGNQGGA